VSTLMLTMAGGWAEASILKFDRVTRQNLVRQNLVRQNLVRHNLVRHNLVRHNLVRFKTNEIIIVQCKV
jgi:hypothetical protein